MSLLIARSLEDTRRIAADWLKKIASEHPAGDEAVVAGLSGHLGSGKTTFVKLVAKEMGITEEITSPTFVIMKIYDAKHGRFSRLVHVDAYRLEKREELQALDWETIVSGKGSLVIIEWPENAGLDDFGEHLHLNFETEGDKRRVTIS